MNGSIVGLAVIAIVAGLFNVGSPRYQHERRSDELREQHLQQVDAIIVTYARNNKSLPESLNEATALTRMYLPRDPETGASYGYKKLDATKYQLCANFRLGGKATGSDGYQSPFVTHPAGSYCFDLAVEKSQPS